MARFEDVLSAQAAAASIWSSISHPNRSPGRSAVDLFARSPAPFDELWERAVTVTIADATVRVVSIDDLIAMKRVADRPQDRADIAALEALRDG